MTPEIFYLTFSNLILKEGANTHTANIIRHWCNQDGVTIIAHHNVLQHCSPAVNLKSYGSPSDRIFQSSFLQSVYYLVKYWSFFATTFKRKDMLVYHRMSLFSFILYWTSRIFWGARTFCFEHNGLLHLEAKLENKTHLARLFQFIQTFCYKKAVINRVVTPQIGAYLEKTTKQHRHFIAGNGFDGTVLREQLNKTAFTPHLKQHSFVFLFVGNLARWQGVELLISAFDALEKRHSLPAQWRLDIIGGGQEKDALMTLTKDCNLENRIVFHGVCSKEEVARRLASEAHVLCAPFAPGRNEVVGNSALKIREYLATGKPILCSAIPYDIDMAAHAVLFRPGDVTECAEKMKDIWENYERYANDALKNQYFAFTHLEWKNIANQVLHELRTAL